MRPQRETTADVLIIGAGPCGLFAAAELARHGLRPRIIEQSLEPHRQTRATAIQPSTLEIFARAGLAKDFLPACLKLRGGAVLDAQLNPAYTVSFEEMDTPFAHCTTTPQWRTEEILESHLNSLGVKVERGVYARTVETTAAASAILLARADGTQELVHARWTIGAGGAHSLMRGVLNEHLIGVTYANSYLVADFSTDFPFDKEYVCYAIAPTGFFMVAALPGNRWVAVIDIGTGPLPVAAAGLAEVRAAIQAHLPGCDCVREVHWASYFHTHRRIAPRFGDGCRFLVGDAAHICSPFGGEGMNAGLQDGADLAWKLALVQRGRGRQLLLDAYDLERRHVAMQVLASADVIHRGYYRLVGLAKEGKKLERAPADSSHRCINSSLLDVSFTSSPLVGEFHAAASAPLAEGAPGTRFRERTLLSGAKHHLVLFEGAENFRPPAEKFAARWRCQMEVVDGAALGAEVGWRAGLPQGGALLVRPDGFVGFRAHPWNDAALAALDAHLEKQWVPQ